MSQIIYSGPGKVYFNAKSFHAQGENGQVKLSLEQKTAAVAQAELGRASETFEDVNAKVSVTPFDDWSLMTTLFPKYLGISTAAITGALKIGAYVHDAAFITSGVTTDGSFNALKLWCAEGTEYDLVRAAITKHPDIMLGASTPLFGSCELTAIGANVGASPVASGSAGYLFATNPVSGINTGDYGSPTAITNPDGTFDLNSATTSFIRERWTGEYGVITAGVGSIGTLMEAEDSWTISVNAKYDPIHVQKVLKHMKLASVEIVAKAKIVGPSHNVMLSEMLKRVSGLRMANKPDGTHPYKLVLNSQSNKSITLPNCEMKGAGITAGGTNVRANETAFVSAYTFTTPGTTDPIMTISA